MPPFCCAVPAAPTGDVKASSNVILHMPKEPPTGLPLLFNHRRYHGPGPFHLPLHRSGLRFPPFVPQAYVGLAVPVWLVVPA